MTGFLQRLSWYDNISKYNMVVGAANRRFGDKLAHNSASLIKMAAGIVMAEVPIFI